MNDRPPISDRPSKLRMRLDSLASLPAVDASVRRAHLGDGEGLAAVLAAAFSDGRWTPDIARKALLDNPEVVAVFVLEAPIAGKLGIAATASARLLPARFPGSGYLHWVGAHPDAGRRGLGRAVSVAALAEFRARGCRDAVLETDDHRLAAIHLYTTFGFRPDPCAPDHEARWRKILAPA